MPKIISLVAPDGDYLVFSGQSLNDTLVGGNGIQTFYGNAGDDLLVGGTGDQQLYGGSGEDTVVAGNGNQVLDGGAGYDVLDLSRIHGRVEIDQDLHWAKVFDPVTGEQIATYSVLSFDKVIGNDLGTTFWAAEYTSRIYIGGAGDDRYYSESGGDTVTLGEGADTFRWYRKYVEDGLTDRITDFTVGTDKLDLRDFLKGQGIKNAVYAQVLQLEAATDADGGEATLIKGLVNGVWHDVVVLDGVKASSVTLEDLVL